MGGNGSYSYFISNSLGSYTKDRYKQVDSIGSVKVVTVTTQDNMKTPMNSFTAKMYYVTAPENPNQIRAIAFYNEKTHKIKKSIDIEYNDDGSLKALRQFTHKGKTKTEGVHVHKWSSNESGDSERKRHDKSNVHEPTKTDMIYIRRAIRYNQRKVKENGR